jgi:hypothetical protein
MQPTVRRARRTADTRGYAHRERAARWGRPRQSTHRDSLTLQDVAKRSAAPISARRAVMGGRARAERRSRPALLPPRRIVHVSLRRVRVGVVGANPGPLGSGGGHPTRRRGVPRGLRAGAQQPREGPASTTDGVLLLPPRNHRPAWAEVEVRRRGLTLSGNLRQPLLKVSRPLLSPSDVPLQELLPHLVCGSSG